MNTPDSFPNEVDLGRDVPDYSKNTFDGPEYPAETKPKKMRKSYPTLYISDAASLDQMPKEGYALIYYKRNRVTLEERDGEDKSSADLEVQSISFPSASKEDEDTDLATAMKEMLDHSEPDGDETESGDEPADDEDEETE